MLDVRPRKNMKKDITIFAILTCLWSCESTRHRGGAGDGYSEASGLESVVGTWKYSHLGKPSIANESTPDPSTFAKDHMKDMRISFDEKGQCSTIVSGQAGSFSASVIEESPLYIKIGFNDQDPEKAFVYDKTTKLLMMPTQLNIGGSEGVLPTYFKKIR